MSGEAGLGGWRSTWDGNVALLQAIAHIGAALCVE
jgi:hypothetical protein